MLVDKDVSFGSHLNGCDVSMESSLEVSNNLNVHNELLVDKNVSFGSHLQVVGDVSMESSLEISNNLIVNNELILKNDLSVGSNFRQLVMYRWNHHLRFLIISLSTMN